MKLLILILVIFCVIQLFPQKVGNEYAININNIYLPLNRTGVLADVNVPPGGSTGQFGGNTFLFSGGFFLSGYSNGQLWANAVASTSLVKDYLQGTYQFGENDPRAQLYKIRCDDPPFGQSWQDWIDAVALGADFYDGDGDSIYNPVDLNGNSLWDPGEDRPDILGDEMLWCVYQDAVPSSQRMWNTVEPQGIEIRQTVFAYSNVQDLQNVFFIRYRILNTGLVSNEMIDVYFGIFDDPDIGDQTDDLVGCDTILQGGYIYNDGPDAFYGNNPPGYFKKTLAGPVTYIPGVTYIDVNGNEIYDEGIDTPLDTAYVHRGQILGITEYPGAKNQTLSSSLEYMHAFNKEEARNFMLGFDRFGLLPDPCTWTCGEVRGGVDCSLVNPLFRYSGDPVSDYGWINTCASDQRQIQNVGPFALEQGREIEIFMAYVIGQGTNALNSITVVKNISNNTQEFYYGNFDIACIVSATESITQNTPKEYLLLQNYPNPFNPSTVISYQLPVSSNITLKVYDVLGNEVATLVDEYKTAGSFEVEWEATNYPSGVYFYQLQSEGYVATRKMILMK